MFAVLFQKLRQHLKSFSVHEKTHLDEMFDDVAPTLREGRSKLSHLFAKSSSVPRSERQSVFGVYRHTWLVQATLRTLVWIVFLGTVIIGLNIAMQKLTDAIEEKIYISIYFNRDVTEDVILAVQDSILEERPEIVHSVQYVPREDSLRAYLDVSGDDPHVRDALDALGGNPFQDALQVRTFDPRDYETVATFFEQSYTDLVYGTSLRLSERTVSELRGRTELLKRVALGVSLFFIGISGLVTFSAVRNGIAVQRRALAITDRFDVETPAPQKLKLYPWLYGLIAGLSVIFFFLIALYLSSSFARTFFFRDVTEGSVFGSGVFITLCVVLIVFAIVGTVISRHIITRRKF